MRRVLAGSRALVVLTALALVACDGDGPAPAADAATLLPSVEVGTGSDSFVPLAEGETVQLVRGCQGLQHVWTSIRTRGLERQRMLVDLGIYEDADTSPRVGLAEPFSVRLTLEARPEWEHAQIVGLTNVVPDPGLVVDRTVVLRVEVHEDGTSRSASDERRVHVVWGPDACANLPPRDAGP